MNHKYRNFKSRENTVPNLLRRVFQWAHYQGGVGFMFIIFGMMLIGTFALLSFWYGYNWVVLGLGSFFVVAGLFYDLRLKK